MGTYSGVIIDKKYLDKNINKCRFVYPFEIDQAGTGQNGRWRQGKTNDGLFWKTAGSEWVFEGNSKQVANRTTLHYQNIYMYDGSYKQNTIVGIPTTKEPNLSAILKTTTSYLDIGQKGTGYLLETGDYGNVQNDTPLLRGKPSNIYWAITENLDAIPPLDNLWMGGAIQYGGKLPGYGKQAIHGYIVNLRNPAKKHYIQIETHSLSAALGGKGGVAILLVNARDPNMLLNTHSRSFNFSFTLGGAISKLIKPLVDSQKAFKFMEASVLAKKIYDCKGMINRSEFLGGSGHLKTLFSGSSIYQDNSYAVIDTPLEVGLEVGLSLDGSTVTLVN